MSFWVIRRGYSPDTASSDGVLSPGSGKRRGSGGSVDYESSDGPVIFSKRARHDDWGHHDHDRDILHDHDAGYFQHARRPEYRRYHDSHASEEWAARTAKPGPSLPFIIIREQAPISDLPGHDIGSQTRSPPQSPLHLQDLRQHTSLAMERTASGLSISSSDSRASPPPDPPTLLTDSAAALLVHNHVSTIRRHSRHSRILKTLIHPKTNSQSKDFKIDDDALESIFSSANDLFFANKLRGRVAWDWSHPTASERYDCAIVGTTALRKRKGGKGGYETLIVLSSPILKDTKYNRRLLISTFLHEMIHSFLFVTCGRKAGQDGGHTDGFRKIAAIIDDWVGKEYLRLSDMEADLDRFTVDDRCDKESHQHDHGRVQDVVFTELDRHLNHWQQHQPQDYPRLSSTHVGMETSPHPSPFAAGQNHSHSHRHHGAETCEEWQWQRREGFGAPRDVYPH